MRMNGALRTVRGVKFGQAFVPPYAEMPRIIRDVNAAICRAMPARERLTATALAPSGLGRPEEGDGGSGPSVGPFRTGGGHL
jgi:hypothetical protein